jgi:ribosomal protein S18 acetylase RimI-like enzyme
MCATTSAAGSSGPMAEPPSFEIRTTSAVGDLDLLEPLWNALQEHHTRNAPAFGPSTPKRTPADSWRSRRGKYESWLEDPSTFIVLADAGDAAAGYAFVTVGAGMASLETGERVAELETLSVLPERRGDGIGEALVEAVWRQLADLGVDELLITTTATNVDARRFYERHGFRPGFVVYYGKRK